MLIRFWKSKINIIFTQTFMLHSWTVLKWMGMQCYTVVETRLGVLGVHMKYFYFLGLTIQVLHRYILSCLNLVGSKQIRHALLFSKTEVVPSYFFWWSHCINQLFFLLLAACSWAGSTPKPLKRNCGVFTMMIMIIIRRALPQGVYDLKLKFIFLDWRW